VTDSWHRRHAVQIVAQLPEDTKDAVQVLELAKDLVEGFLIDRQPRLRSGAIVVLAAASNSALNLPGSPSSLPK
jgi:hypothetical protein